MRLYTIQKDDPDAIANIDTENSVVICTLEHLNNLIFDEHYLHISATNEFHFYNQKIVGNDIIYNYNPHIKWSVPKGIDIIFEEPMRKKPFYNRIYPNYNSTDDGIDNFIVSDLSFTFYFDKLRMKDMITIENNSKLLKVDFVPGIFYSGEIRNCYFIKNNYVYNEFKQHFKKEEVEEDIIPAAVYNEFNFSKETAA